MPTNKKTVSDSDTTKPTTDNINTSETMAAATAAETAKPQYSGITSFIYVGPSLPGGQLKSFTTLNGTYEQITDYYKEAIQLFPNVARLIIPVAQLAEIREKTQKSGNIMHNYYQEIAAAIKAKGGNR